MNAQKTARRLVRLLDGADMKIATAESMTGGLIASLITSVPGASRVFGMGFCTYCNEMKSKYLGVSGEVLGRPGGEISARCAGEMASGAAAAACAQVAVSVTGLAGSKPDGGVPVSFRRLNGAGMNESGSDRDGRVFIGIYINGKTDVFGFDFYGGRNAVRLAAAGLALDAAYRALSACVGDDRFKVPCDTESFYIRRFRESDIDRVISLFRNTVLTVCRKDYTEKQTEAWASSANDRARWLESLSAHFSLVAESGGSIAGFADADTEAGYIDRLYVAADRQRRGIGSALCDRLEKACSGRTVTTHASVTAKPFFLARGYRMVRQQTVVRNGISMVNFVMEKQARP